MIKFFKGKREMERFVEMLKFLSSPEEKVTDVLEKLKKIKNNEIKIIEDMRPQWEGKGVKKDDNDNG